MLSTFGKVLKKIDSGIDLLAAVALACTFALVFLNVVLRYVFHSGLAWSEEGARYLFICTVCMGFISVTHYRQHFSTDLAVKAMPHLLQKIFGLLKHLLMAGLLVLIIMGGFDMISLNWHNKSPAIGLPSAALYIVLTFSAVMMLFYIIINTVEDITGKRFNEPGKDVSDKM